MASNEEHWKLKEKQLTVPGGIKLELSAKSDVVSLLDWHLPHWDSKLHTIPHLTRIRREDLFSDRHDIYDSEVKDVYQCLCEVPNLTGIAVHSYDQKNASKTFSNVKPERFEIDWVLVNSSGVFVIEVGYAKEASNSANIINKKVKQITSSKHIMRNVLSASDSTHSEPDLFSEIDITLIVALPNTPLSQIREWMKKKDNKCFSDEHSLVFFTQETLTMREVFRSSELQKCHLNYLFGDKKPEQQQLQLKFVSGLFVVGKFAVLKSDSPVIKDFALLTADVSQYETKQRKYKKESGERNDLDRVLDQIKFPDNLVLTAEQYDCLDAIIFGYKKTFSVIGEAGTGKSTVLILLLIYYTGRNQEKEKRKPCLFLIPESKRSFREFVEGIVDKLCDNNFVVFHGIEDNEYPRVLKEITYDSVILVDELYSFPGEVSQGPKHFLLHLTSFSKSHKCVYTFVSSGQLGDHTYYSSRSRTVPISSFSESTFIMRKWLRNSSHIAKLAAKIKRLVNLNNNNFIGLFDSGQPNPPFFAASSQNGLPVALLDSSCNLKQDLIISYSRSYTSRKETGFQSQRFFRVQVDNGSMQDWDFTGIEGLSAAVILDLPNLPKGNALANLLLFLYSAITRARTDFAVFCSSSLLDYVKDLLQLDETDKALNKLQSGGVLSWDELVSCWPNDDRQVAFIALAVHNSDIKLSQYVSSLVLQNSVIILDAFRFPTTMLNTKKDEAILPALFLYFALIKPFKTEDTHFYIADLLLRLPQNPLQILLHSEWIKFSLALNHWNMNALLLEKYRNLIPIDTITRRKDPILTAMWFPDERSFSECYPESWTFEVIEKMDKISFTLLDRPSLIPTLISKLKCLLARDDAIAKEFKRNGKFPLLTSIYRHKNWSLLTTMINSIPDCLEFNATKKSSFLHQAAMLGDELVPFEIVLRHNKDSLFEKDSMNFIPVERAFVHGNIQLVNYLFDSYLDLFLQQGEPKQLPFVVIFSTYGDLDRLKKLIAKQHDLINSGGPYGCLYPAARHGHANTIQFLLNSGAADVFELEASFYAACLVGSVEICSMLLERFVVINGGQLGNMLLQNAFACLSVGKNAVEIAKYLLEQDLDHSFSKSPRSQSLVFLSALISGNHKLINFLSEHLDEKRADLTDCVKASITASQKSQGKSVSYPANYNFFNLDPLLIRNFMYMCIAEEGMEEYVNKVIIWCEKYRHKISDDIRKAILKYACEKGHLQLVKYFSVYEPHLLTPSKPNFDESSLLLKARKNGQEEVTKYLMKYHPALLIQVFSLEISKLLLLS